MTTNEQNEKTMSTTSDQEHDPQVWPQCSECGMAYVHRRGLSFGTPGGYRWVWQQDCKHGRKGSTQPAPVLADVDGPLEHVAETNGR